MFGKKKRDKQRIESLVADTAYALDDFMGIAEGAAELLARLNTSRKQVWDAANADEEVESCKEDLRTAMQAAGWRLYGDGADDVQIDRIYRVVRKHLDAFAELVLTARLGGYAVARYIYKVEHDGFISIDRVADRRDELERYTPRRDGSLVFNGDSGEELLDTQVLHLLLTSKASSKNPAGDFLLARLYPAISVRRNGFVYAHQFIKRYAQPYMVGKIGGDAKSFVGKLYGFISGGALTINTDEDVAMLQNSANGEAFETLERIANARIQKLLLGRVKTADLANSSRAAQETEEDTRQDRIVAYLTLLGLAVQHAVDALVIVNEAYGQPIKQNGGLWFEFEAETKVDKTRAERDQIYAAMGVKFTHKYYEEMLGIEAEHFELAEPTPPTAAALSLRLSGAADSPQAGSDGLAPAPAFNRETTLMRPKIEAVQTALAEAESFEAFQTALAQMDLSAGDLAIVDQLVAQSCRAIGDELEA